MTKKEAFIAMVGVPVDSSVIDLALLNNGLDGTTAYAATDKAALEKSLIDVLFGVVTLQSQSEGDASISYNYEAVKSRLLMLAKKYGNDEVLNYFRPTLTSRPIW